jgi:glutathione synthase/RimK-type ligase-like ATP-grasp enzyme
MTKIAFATSAEHATLTADDLLAVAAADSIGLTIEPAVWNDAAVVWQDFDAVVIRSCWDYHHQPDHFRAWVDQLEAAAIPLWNPPSVIRWNSNKRYLQELSEWGISTVATVYLEAGAQTDLSAQLAQHGWTDAVIKPAISASAFNTWRLSDVAGDETQQRFAAQLAESPTLIQPYMPEIEAGEWSLIYFNGDYSHAALKRPLAGDFRVQGAFGGNSKPEQPNISLIEQGAKIMAEVQARLGQRVLYVRVDGIIHNGQLMIMELELIEPSLFIGFEAGAAERFARAITQTVH